MSQQITGKQIAIVAKIGSSIVHAIGRHLLDCDTAGVNNAISTQAGVGLAALLPPQEQVTMVLEQWKKNEAEKATPELLLIKLGHSTINIHKSVRFEWQKNGLFPEKHAAKTALPEDLTATVSAADVEVTDDQMTALHVKIDYTWKTIARFLGPKRLTNAQIDRIAKSSEYNDDKDRCYEMLQKWSKEQTGGRGKVFDLLNTLLHDDIGLDDVAEKVFKKPMIDKYRKWKESSQ
eukprot:m.24204 g.24204  ORF g.24204 m.24204 type:complete len:234 (+) comp28575_c0_seq2:92-793(+)